MSDEIPDWLEEVEDVPDWLTEIDEPEAEFETAVEKDDAKSKAKLASKNAPLTPPQMAILATLTLLLCLICAGIAGATYLGREALFNRPAQEMAAVPPVENTPPSPTPSPTPPNTPTPRPTIALPQSTATLEPTPTATYAVAPELLNKEKITGIKKFVEQYRQLRLPEDMPTEFLTHAHLRAQWKEDSLDKAAIEAVQTQQELYTVLGLIEPDVDLVQVALDTQTDMVLGYYSLEEKVMYIIAESVNMFAQEEMTFAHEYTHALQDYHFDLNRIFNDDYISGDALLAARALPEGDARLVEELFTSQNINQDQIEYTIYRYLFQEHPPIEGVSPALGILVYFPYTAGEYFVIHLFIEGGFSWDKVNEAYNNPPVSSEQVMHPEKYLAGEKPAPITLPDLAPALGNPWHEIDRDVLGEIGLLVWLADRVEELTAFDAVAGWDGDAYTLWVDDANHRVLAELSLWESPAEATEFFEGFNAYMNLREGEDAGYEESGTRFWEYEEGITLLSRNGRQVLVVIAPDRATLDGVRNQFAGF